jgi:hypothetical protein
MSTHACIVSNVISSDARNGDASVPTTDELYPFQKIFLMSTLLYGGRISLTLLPDADPAESQEYKWDNGIYQVLVRVTPQQLALLADQWHWVVGRFYFYQDQRCCQTQLTVPIKFEGTKLQINFGGEEETHVVVLYNLLQLPKKRLQLLTSLPEEICV